MKKKPSDEQVAAPRKLKLLDFDDPMGVTPGVRWKGMLGNDKLKKQIQQWIDDGFLHEPTLSPGQRPSPIFSTLYLTAAGRKKCGLKSPKQSLFD